MQSEDDLPVGRLIKELADPETRESIAAAVISSRLPPASSLNSCP